MNGPTYARILTGFFFFFENAGELYRIPAIFALAALLFAPTPAVREAAW